MVFCLFTFDLFSNDPWHVMMKSFKHWSLAHTFDNFFSNKLCVIPRIVYLLNQLKYRNRKSKNKKVFFQSLFLSFVGSASGCLMIRLFQMTSFDFFFSKWHLWFFSLNAIFDWTFRKTLSRSKADKIDAWAFILLDRRIDWLIYK